VRHYRVLAGRGSLVAEQTYDHHTRNTIAFDPPLRTDWLDIEIVSSHGPVPAALFAVRCYGA